MGNFEKQKLDLNSPYFITYNTRVSLKTNEFEILPILGGNRPPGVNGCVHEVAVSSFEQRVSKYIYPANFSKFGDMTQIQLNHYTKDRMDCNRVQLPKR